jgi:ElaB/YqjD/DUF883 family membrane-anchored ribosome-binding protein
MSNGTTPSSKEIEQEADASRAQLSSTLDELKDKLTPGQIFDEVFGGSSANAGKFLRNFGVTLREHPMPAVLVGAGLAMMMMGTGGAGTQSSRTSGPRRQSSHAGEAFRGERDDYDAAEASGRKGGALDDVEPSTVGTVGESLSAARDTAEGIAGGMRERLHDYRDEASEAAGRIGEKLSDLSDRVAKSSRSMARRAGNLSDMVAEQPLVVAALGLAVGAAMAAALPSSEAENQLMGDASDTLKTSAGEMASDQVQNVKEAVETVVSDVKSEASAQALDLDNARSATDQLGQKFTAVADRAADTLKRETDKTFGQSDKSQG